MYSTLSMKRAVYKFGIIIISTKWPVSLSKSKHYVSYILHLEWLLFSDGVYSNNLEAPFW